jgi:hypothetical protein
MSEHEVAIKELAGTAKTIVPEIDRQYPLATINGSNTFHEDEFFAVESVVATGDSEAMLLTPGRE